MDFILRPWRIEDAETLASYANNSKIAANLRDAFPHPYTVSDAAGYINFCLGMKDELCFAIEVDGKAVGSIGVFLKDDVYRKSAELGYWLAEPFWGKGIMSEAVSRICEQAFSEHDIVRIFAEPFARNLGSRRVLEKAGFELEGILKKSVFKNGAIEDSCMYAKLRD